MGGKEVLVVDCEENAHYSGAHDGLAGSAGCVKGGGENRSAEVLRRLKAGEMDVDDCRNAFSA